MSLLVKERSLKGSLQNHKLSNRLTIQQQTWIISQSWNNCSGFPYHSVQKSSQSTTVDAMATPRACQCFKFTGKIRTMFNQINPHHFSCLYKMTFERHAVKALRCCDAPRTDRPQRCRRHRGAGENAAVCDGATTTESSSEDDCSPSPTPDTGFRPRSFTVSVFDRLQLNVGLLSDSSTDVSRIISPLIPLICKSLRGVLQHLGVLAALHFCRLPTKLYQLSDSC